MPAKSKEARAELIEESVALARKNLDPERAATFAAFLAKYYGDTPMSDIGDRKAGELYGAALAHYNLGQDRKRGEPKIRVYTPQFEQDGWQSTHTVVEVVTDDMPFLVDSVRNEILRHGLGIHLVLHPIVAVERDRSGHATSVVDDDDGTEEINESFMHFEIDRVTRSGPLKELRNDLLRVLGDVRAAVMDWPPMRDKLREILQELEEDPPDVDDEELAGAKEFLGWVTGDHFTFLGYREYELKHESGDDVLEEVAGTGLGILRSKGKSPSGKRLSKLPKEIRRHVRDKQLLVLTKANSKATVHRPSRLDYIGIKRFKDGEVIGERRFLGLYTSIAYNTSPTQIPLLKRKYDQVVERSGFAPGTHSRKDLESVLERFPRDELFQGSVDEIFEAAMEITHLQERQRLRLLVRRDRYGRFFSCLVFLPRDRYNTDARERIQQILIETFDGIDVEYSTQVSESALARLHYIVHTDPNSEVRYDIEAVERKLAAAIRTWTDDLRAALIEEFGEEQGLDLLDEYGDAFPRGYQATTAPRRAAADIHHLEELGEQRDLRTSLHRRPESDRESFRFKIYTSGERIMLSEMLPTLENMGVKVVEEHPHEVRASGGRKWIFDLGLTYSGPDPLESDEVRGLFQETFARVWNDTLEDDGFNRLALRAKIGWRDITLLRAYFKYLRQTGSLFSQNYVEDTLVNNPDIAHRLIDLFHARFDPSGRQEDLDGLRDEISESLDEVQSLDEDRILHSYLALITATLRTNFYQTEADGSNKNRLSIKLDPGQIPDLPLPRPAFEIFVYSPRTEGVHLRGGRVARGGIRWSDRREDFRTEILGLMKAQQVKNAVIVPVGAKGGFVVKQPPEQGGREALAAEVQACYKVLIRGLLDVTDNLVDGEVKAPEQVVRYDDDDTYLVVAADKGTATFSDLANEISNAYGYWLGDAFASGGSKGYDHKEMGITARGAWESVKRHFRELSTDIQSDDFTVIGIGDMSGDVFGNGMLLSERTKLIAAFDHRHIFIDPDPDPEASFKERKRLFEMSGSSWDDYDKNLLSAGGGVYPRSAKSVKLSQEARKALRIEAEKVTPNQLVSAILRAPVDLFWSGGVGTFVKASDESHAEAGDRTNDGVRVNADELQCKVVGEGGNLGLTQRARVEFAQSGGRVNADFIDNSAGVDCSDHEVNIKILLDSVVAAGDMTLKQRNTLLAQMTDEVGDLVLHDNYEQARALANSMSQATSMFPVYERYIRSLEETGRLDRALEFLPDEEEMEERRSGGGGLCSPEFAILLSYTKLRLEEQLLDSDVPEDPYLAGELERYFPTRLRQKFEEAMHSHPLRRQIVATQVANQLVNVEGTTFVFRLAGETGALPEDIARAHTISRECLESHDLLAQVEDLGFDVPASTQTQMILEIRKLTERVTRWLLRHASDDLDVSKKVETFGPGCKKMWDLVGDLVSGSEKRRFDDLYESLCANGVRSDLARKVAGCQAMASSPDIVEVARATQESVENSAAVHFLLGDQLGLWWLRERVLALPREGRWQTLARDALRGDLAGWHSALSADVISSSDGDAPSERVRSWIEDHHEELANYRSILKDMEAGESMDLATMSVALRQVRTLTHPGSRPPSS